MSKVLVIEDNEQNLYLITFLLKKNGFEVISATNGYEGISLAGETLPDIILLDIQLPQMDGFTVIKKLREIPTLKDTLVVAVTSYAMVGDREYALKAGFDAYIEKPINPDTFIKELRNILKGG